MIIIGHRGARGLAPENTLASIEKALACGVDEVEVDVRVTEDGIPVLSHDRFIRLEGRVLRIDHQAYDELKQAKSNLATLAEALEAVAGRSTLLIEVKHGEPVEPVIDVIRRRGNISGILIGSKSQKVLKALHRALPEVPTVVIEPWSGVRATYRARQLGTKRISMRSWWLWHGFLRMMHRRGYLMVPYTLNNPGKVVKWQNYIYGVVTDNPDRFVR